MKFNIGSKGTLLSQPRQQGIALLVFFIVIFLAGAGAIITVLDKLYRLVVCLLFGSLLGLILEHINFAVVE